MIFVTGVGKNRTSVACASSEIRVLLVTTAPPRRRTVSGSFLAINNLRFTINKRPSALFCSRSETAGPWRPKLAKTFKTHLVFFFLVTNVTEVGKKNTLWNFVNRAIYFQQYGIVRRFRQILERFNPAQTLVYSCQRKHIVIVSTKRERENTISSRQT